MALLLGHLGRYTWIGSTELGRSFYEHRKDASQSTLWKHRPRPSHAMLVVEINHVDL